MKKNKLSVIAALLLLSVIFIGADGSSSCDSEVDDVQRHETEKLVSEAHGQVGMPDIINFQERRLAKQILEMRDKEIATHTYIKNDMRGCLVYLGPSIGYGLPYAVQFTNPEKYEYSGATLPQPDPNGLFMPDSLSATWVILSDPATGKTAPVYVEPEITVSPFRIRQAECK